MEHVLHPAVRGELQRPPQSMGIFPSLPQSCTAFTLVLDMVRIAPFLVKGNHMNKLNFSGTQIPILLYVSVAFLEAQHKVLLIASVSNEHHRGTSSTLFFLA